MKKTFTLFFLLLTISLFAQPTITSTWLPNIGDKSKSVVGLDANLLGPGEIGPNASWDYSDVEQDPDAPVAGFEFMNPNVSDFGHLFPDANLALTVSGADPNTLPATFYKATNDRYELLGNALPMTSFIYTDPQIFMMMPFSFGDSFMDDFAADLDFNGIKSFVIGDVEVTADAFGTITTPNGIYSDVIRIKTVTNRVDSTVIGPGSFSLIQQEIESYIWLKNSMSNAIATLTISNGQTVTVTSGMTFTDELPENRTFNWAEMNPSSTEDVEGNFTLNIRSFGPNPMQDNLNIVIDSDEVGALKLEVLSDVGQLVKTRTYKIINGPNSLNMNVSTMPRGKYLLRLTHKGGKKILPIQKI